jgi:hypothetical protein
MRVYQQYNPAVASIPVTVTGEADIWRDIYSVTIMDPIQKGARLFGHLTKQLVNPSACPDNIAWLRTFYLKTPTKRISLWAGPGNNGMLGTNITRDGHYESMPESFLWYATDDFPAGCIISYHGRAKTARAKRYYMEVMHKGILTVEVSHD